MCLITKDKFPGITLKEQEVFKIILCNPGCNYWEAPLLRSIHAYNKVLNTNNFKIGEHMLLFTPALYTVGEGYFHAFKNVFYANYMKSVLMNENNERFLKIVKAKIPKGSLYYEHGNEICSNKIIVYEELF